jgi:hypothetical protein
MTGATAKWLWKGRERGLSLQSDLPLRANGDVGTSIRMRRVDVEISGLQEGFFASDIAVRRVVRNVKAIRACQKLQTSKQNNDWWEK